jgi:hypothetical protein
MARTVEQDAPLRDRLRRNVGYPHHNVLIHGPQADSPRARFRSARGPAGPPPPAPIPGVPVAGRSYTINQTVLSGTRKVTVSRRVGFPCQVRKITLMGDGTMTEAISYRLFVSDDDDAAALADPTGDELVFPVGDLIGAEDQGLHAALSLGPLYIEPFVVVAQAGRFFKLKTHNVSGFTRNVVAYFDVDQLAV